MMSKISFFNKTIFWKNVNLYWPLWGLYTVILVFAQPILLWIEEYSAQYYVTYSYGDHLSNLLSVVSMEWHIMIIAIGAILSGMALFHYLYNSKSANMIHALPVDRIQLFCTNVISGVAFLAVPQLLSSILTVIVALAFGLKEIQYIAIWFLMVLGTDIVAFAFVTFCAMFTGHIVALPAYVLIVNYFVYWVYYLIEVVVSGWGYGIDSIGARFQGLLDLFCPLNAFLLHVDISAKYDNTENYECIGAEVYGFDVILVYLVVAVLLYVAAYMIYRKRHIEQAGEVLTVSWVKPIFRFGVGLTGGFFGSSIICEILHSIGINCGLAGFVIVMLLIGAICYFIADMLVKKSFHVFKKKNWLGCGVFSVVMLVAFLGILGIADSMENYVPKLSEVESASVNLGYGVHLEGEEAEAIIEIHEGIMANKEVCEEYENNGYSYDYVYVDITYYLKNGEYVNRSYRLPREYKGLQSVFAQIAALERDVDNYLTYTFCEDYEDISVFNGGWLEAQFSTFSKVGLEVMYDSGAVHAGNDDYVYQTIDLTSEQVESLYRAVIADAKAGTLMGYNVYSDWRENAQDIAHKYSEAYLYIEFMDPNQDNSGALVRDENSYSTMFGTTTKIVEYQSWNCANINFGPDCENIVNTLIELGVIESEKDIWWGEYEE